MQRNFEDSLVEQVGKLLVEPRGSLRCWTAYLLLMLLPPGYVVSYKALAEIVGGSPRGVAACMRSNRLAPIIPCHRVVASTGELGGYSRGGPRVKERLLRVEGVSIRDGRVQSVIRSGAEFWKIVEANGHIVNASVDE